MISMAMMPETEADILSGSEYSCTVVIGQTILFFGGCVQSRQISQLTPVGLMRIGTLPFELTYGTCLLMSSQLFLGFHIYNTRSCWSR